MAESRDWDVYVIEYAVTAKFPWVNLISGMSGDGLVELPFSFIFARRDDRLVLIDTGFMREPGRIGADIPSWVSPVRMLGELGVAAGDITDIFVTHGHFDHMGSIAEFPNARIFIQKSELLTWYEWIALPRQFGYLTAIIDPGNLRTALEASIEHRVTLIDGDRDDVLPGIHVRLAPGHTMGHQLVILETVRGRLVISGDCIYARRQLAGHKGDGVYAPLNNATGSVFDQLKSIDRLNAELGGTTERLIILHDTERWKGLPVVKEVDGFRIVKAA